LSYESITEGGGNNTFNRKACVPVGIFVTARWNFRRIDIKKHLAAERKEYELLA